MATLAELKTRVALELTRDDMGSGGELETALSNAITSAIALYSDLIKWFNRDTGSVSTVAATATVALPSGMRYATQVSYAEEPLLKVELDDILPLTDSGQPSRWAMNDTLIQLWPIPDAVYSLSVQGAADPATATFIQDEYDLLAARTKIILCRFPLRDEAGEAAASREETEILSRIHRESRKRRQTPLRGDFEGSRYNIETDR